MRFETRLTLLAVVPLLVVAALFSAVSYQRVRSKAEKYLGERLQAMASAAAAGIDGDAHERIHTNADAATPEFQQIREHLRRVQRANGLKPELIYTLRPQGAGTEFVVMLHDQPFVGDTYQLREPMRTALASPRGSHTDVYRDDHGEWLSGYAPILDSAGRAVALLEIDYDASFVSGEARRSTIAVLIWLFPASLLMAIMVYLVVRRVFRPFRRLVGVAVAPTIDTHRALDELARHDGSDEVSLLSRSLAEKMITLRRLADSANEIAAGNLSVTVEGEGDIAEAFRGMVRSLRALASSAKEIASGNLGVTIEAHGEMADAFRTMVVNLRSLVEHIDETTVQINAAAAEILATARQQEEGATSQASAVEETRRTMESLLGSASQIATSSHTVLNNAERTLQNYEVVDNRSRELQAHTERVGEILEQIKAIATKSDLLALNAALEGTKAGEAGRGFSLVAAQMQRLAENVMEAVEDIKSLVTDIGDASRASVLATEGGTRVAGETTTSARQITLITQQQQSGTEQVKQSMDDISELLHQSLAGSRQATVAIGELNQLSKKLQSLVARFELGRDGSGKARLAAVGGGIRSA